MKIIIPSSKIYSTDLSLSTSQTKSINFPINDIKLVTTTKTFEMGSISEFEKVEFPSSDLETAYYLNSGYDSSNIDNDGKHIWFSRVSTIPYYKSFVFKIKKTENNDSVIASSLSITSTKEATKTTYENISGEFSVQNSPNLMFEESAKLDALPTEYKTEQVMAIPKIFIAPEYEFQKDVYSQQKSSGDIVEAEIDSEDPQYYNVSVRILYAIGVLSFGADIYRANFGKITTSFDNGKLEEYIATSIEFELLGKCYTLNIEENTLTAKEGEEGAEITLNSNNFVQNKYKDDFQNDLRLLFKEYKNGKTTATLTCAIGEYYDTDGNNIVSTKTTDKMVFEHYDEVVPMYKTTNGIDAPISLTEDYKSKTFLVLCSEIYFDGAVWQKLSLQEYGSVDIRDGTPSLTYEISEDKTYAICTGIKDSEIKILDIATNVNGIIVQEIGVEAFRKGYDQSSIPNVAKVNIPNTVLSIGSRAFQYLNIPKIKLPSNLVSIGSGAFNVNSLTQIDIPNSTTFIGSSAFASCNNLTKVSLGENLKNVEEGAFGLCYKMTDICFNAIEMNDVTSSARIFSSSGRSANGINVIIGQKVKRIPAYLFYTDVLNQIYLPPKISNVKFEENSVCKSIGEGAFSHIDNSFEIEIPPSIEFIGSDAFYNSYVDKVHIKDIANWCNINFASPSANPIYQSANIYINNEIVEDLVIPNTVTEIKPYSFIMCGSLISVLIPNSVKIIGDYAFDECYGLYSVYYMGSDVDWANISIGGSNSGLTNAIIYYYSETEPSDEGHYWHYVNGEITVWGSENSVAMYSRISPKQTPNRYTTEEGFGVEEYDYTAILYRYKGDEAQLVLPRYINYKQYQIGDCAFAENETLEAISIPSTVTYIGDFAFSNCANLKDVYYEGTRSQWNNIYIGNGNEALLSANIHFGSFIS